MEGRLLNYVESFNWADKNLNRSTVLQDYNNALTEARKIGDQVFCPESMYTSENRDIIFQLMWFNNYQSYNDLKTHFEWLQVDDFQTLQSISYILGNPTPNSSNTWEEFANEFNDKNRSLIGLRDDNCRNPLVHDKITHEKFHSDYVASFDLDRQKNQFKYFKKYYKPYLKTDAMQIAKQIRRGQVNSGIIRLDPPPTSPDGTPIHGQQIHIHIMIGNKECALNIDGTWKHRPNINAPNNRIPVEICSTLSQWGFCLPDEYYR